MSARSVVPGLAGRIALVVAGALLLYVLAWPTEPIVYPEVIVPARAIEVREVPGAVRWRDRIVYRYVTADVTARAPQGAALEVSEFCRPVVMTAAADSAPLPPPRELVRSVQVTPSPIPLRRGSLFVSSVTSHGDLLGRDYTVRDRWGLRAGDSLVVRYPRGAFALEVAEGVAWYAALRLIEAGVRAVR